ncbi:hypothetical protein [Acutalibacter caecimuris]|uniref:hypothetical protein n=1 Tax=Acutalibacter caecimuris TaxID=3093657 RepID=UPI002AC97D54|nr:hypothetical protein [Acutalibacter sp. M00118]
MEKWILFVVFWICGAIFLGIGIYAWRLRDRPMNFWSGREVPRESITDLPGYNRAMGRLWGGYGVIYFITGLAAFWQPVAAVVLMCLLGTAGAAALVLIYKKVIEKRYRVK